METLRIPLADGVELGADLYKPTTASKGIVLVRGPYGRSFVFSRPLAAVWAAQGYTVLFVSSRGTADSGGVLDPMRTEARDGHDVIAWMRTQPWYDGRFATMGVSYLGHTQWAILDEPEPDHVAAIIAVGPHDFARHTWGTGSFNLDQYGWAEQIVLLRGNLLRTAIGLATSERRLRPLMRAVPTADAVLAHFRDRTPWLRDRLTRSDIDDPYWAGARHEVALQRANIPILIFSGLQDLFERQSVEQFRTLTDRGVTTAMTLGPWTHNELSNVPDIYRETLAWLDTYLAGEPHPRPHRVRVFDSGTQRWLESENWPVASRTIDYTLGGDGVLGGPPGERSFVYDPADATPTIGGNVITSEGGFRDDSPLAAREDVLVWETAPLTDDLALGGAPQVVLENAAEYPDADVFVRISDVDPNGRAQNVSEGFVRLQGEAVNGKVRIELFDTAHTFRAGHRLRSVVAGGSFPQFAGNSGYGGNPLMATKFRANRHTITGGTLTLPLR
ncbi:CocE/NonD family hydrolase [Georgenia sp. TF02-10]|uniref:CocE/NonD family hydrolase n=1 Tax=Georgenia sp. TF02-10 TaxID=2917725 RepID=UPI001FA6E400|nr:CocE/NonD family hydrolase [Georgenia sp. TF02-10]UNX55513.1 CocE/NonD family hydrolase [Georgenia sp. TF02-10]